MNKTRVALPLALLAAWIGVARFEVQSNDVHFHHVHLNVVDPQQSMIRPAHASPLKVRAS